MGAPTLNRKNISRLVNKFCLIGTVNNLHHHRMHTVLTPETLATALSTLSEMQNKSLRRVAKEQNVSYGITAHHATGALQLHPYSIRVTRELSPLDSDQCLHYCNWLLTNFTTVPTQPTSLNNIFFFW